MSHIELITSARNSRTGGSTYNGRFAAREAKEYARTKAISMHPAAKTHPVLVRAVLFDKTLQLNDAMDALDRVNSEGVRIEASSPRAGTDGLTPFQQMQQRLDEYYGQTENGGQAA